MDAIKIDGYKSINSLSLEIKGLNILIGGNGAGKSNFISFFQFLNSVYNKRLTAHVNFKGGPDKFFHHGSEPMETIYAYIRFKGGTNAYEFRLQNASSKMLFTLENLHYNTDTEDISSYNDESNINKGEMYRSRYIKEYLSQLHLYHFHDTSYNSPFTKMSHIQNDIYYLYSQGDNLAAYIYNIKNTKNKAYNRIVKNIQSIASYFSDFYLQPNQQGYIRLQWQSKHSEYIYGVNDLSDGTLRFIALTVLFMQPNPPNVLIIDEPELGLHPTAIEKLSGMMKLAVAKGSKVIVATQSANLVGHFEAEDIITVDNINGESRFQRLDSSKLSQWLDDYSLGEIWKNNIISKGQP